MWTRAELKSRAKNCLKKYYWAALAVTVIAGILSGGFGGGGGASFSNSSGSGYSSSGSSSGSISGPSWEIMTGILMLVLVIALVFIVIGLVFSAFVSSPIIVGKNRFFMESREYRASAGVSRIFYAFGSGHYLNVVKTMFLTNLFITLWTFLFIIPGIIKSYQYLLVPYILAENPEMNYRDAQRLSREMMKGQKFETFVLELSFFGWYLLGLLLCCIGVIFVNPYMEATKAELYAVLRTRRPAAGLRGFVPITYVEQPGENMDGMDQSGMNQNGMNGMNQNGYNGMYNNENAGGNDGSRNDGMIEW